jgi:hypothetical protein
LSAWTDSSPTSARLPSPLLFLHNKAGVQ